MNDFDDLLLDDLENVDVSVSANVVPVGPALGNTIPTPKRCSTAKNWVCTLYGPIGPDFLIFSSKWKSDLDTSDVVFRYVYQHEVCPSTARTHIQAWVSFTKRVRFLSVFPEYKNSGHFEAQKAKRDSDAYRYCVKDDTCVPGTRMSNFKIPMMPRKVVSKLAGKVLYPWQQEIYDLFPTEPDERKCYWYWEPTGNAGKSSFIRHMKIEFPGRVFSVGGKAADIKFGFIKFVEKNEDCRMCFFDLCRSQEDFISYQSIEDMKNGDFFSTKYESTDLVFEPPHVVVFANVPPDQSKLSADRWVIKRIDDENHLVGLTF